MPKTIFTSEDRAIMQEAATSIANLAFDTYYKWEGFVGVARLYLHIKVKEEQAA